MIKYNWKDFLRAGGSCDGAISLFVQVATRNYKSVNKLKKALIKRPTYGYILNEKDFVGIIKQNIPNDICVYLKLASMRNFALYLEKEDDRLPIYLFEGDSKKLEHNPLITLDDNYIYFKY